MADRPVALALHLLGRRVAQSCSIPPTVFRSTNRYYPGGGGFFFSSWKAAMAFRTTVSMCTHSSSSFYFLGAFRFWRLLKTVMVGCMNGRLFAPVRGGS